MRRKVDVDELVSTAQIAGRCGRHGRDLAPSRRRRSPVRAAIAATGVVSVLSACNLDQPAAPSTTLEEPPAPLPPGCSPPKELVRYTSGFATVDITSGPGTGRLRLPTAGRRTTSNYSAGSGDVRGRWNDASDNLLIVNVFNAKDCKADPRAYVQIEPQATGPGATDTLPRFAEVYPPRSCEVELTALSARGVDGTFTCTRLGGGGGDGEGSGWARAGVYIDASGTFALRA